MGKRENELKLLDSYGDEIVNLGEELANFPDDKKLQKRMTQKIEIYEKQINSFKNEYPNDDEIAFDESMLYCFKGMHKASSHGFLRRMSNKTDSSAMAIATGLVAKQQEKAAFQEALQLFDKAIQICDDPSAHFPKAEIYRAMNQKEDALRELNHIINKFPDHNLYLEARKMKDEIENPPKKGGCFIATCVYGSYSAPEVKVLRNFRDQVLLRNHAGQLFVRSYYAISPKIVLLINNKQKIKTILKNILIDPLVNYLKKNGKY